MRKTLKALLIALVVSLSLGVITACKKTEEPKKTKLESPAIASTAYTGSVQIATVPENEGYTVETNAGGINVGDYEVVLTLTDSKKYEWANPDTNDKTKVTLTFTITKATNEITALSLDGWAYGAQANEPTATAKFGTATFTYATSENGTYTATVPIEAGNYWVKATVAGTTNYDEATKTAQFEISQVGATVKTAPTAKTLTYNETAQALVEAGASDHGTIEYKLGENGTWSVNIPTATDAGEYSVYYRVKGDNNHTDLESDDQVVTVTIAKGAGEVAFSLEGKTVHCGKEIPEDLFVATAKGNGVITYTYAESETGTYYTAAEMNFDFEAGKTYYVKATAAASDNYLTASAVATVIATHKYSAELKKVSRGNYAYVCACGAVDPNRTVPQVAVLFIVDGVEIHSLNINYGSVLTQVQIDEAVAQAGKNTDRKVLSVNYDVDSENDEDVEILEDCEIAINMDNGVMVAISALNVNDAVRGDNVTAVRDEATEAPEGFTVVYKTTDAKGSIKVSDTETVKSLGVSMAYNRLSLANYKTVYFAMKTDGYIRLEKPNKSATEYTGNEWVFVTLSNGGDHSWDIVIKTANGDILLDEKNYTAPRNDGFYVADSLNDILYGSRYYGIVSHCADSTGTTLTTWATEIRATRLPDRIGSAITDVKVSETNVFGDGTAVGGITQISMDNLKVTGFAEVYESEAASSEFSYPAKTLSDVSLTNYSGLRFAVMVDKAYVYVADNINIYKEYMGSLMYYTLTQTADNTWTVIVADEGGHVIATKENLNGIRGGYQDNSLSGILWGAGDLFKLEKAATGAKVYCTELRGTLKAGA